MWGCCFAAGRTPDEAAAGIREVLRTLQSMWLNTEFVLMAMLPRADDLFRVEMVRACAPPVSLRVDPPHSRGGCSPGG